MAARPGSTGLAPTGSLAGEMVVPRRWWLILLVAALGAFPAACADADEEQGADAGGQASEERAGKAVQDGGAPGAASWRRAPILPRPGPRAGERLAAEVARSAQAGMRGGVFAKVGDSNSDYPAQLYGLGCRPVQWGPHRDLIPTRRRYASSRLGGVATFPRCGPANSFSRDSAAAASNATTSWALTPVGDPKAGAFALPPAGCPEGTTPVECEIEAIRPRWVTIMIGSGDAIFGEPLGRTLAGRLAELVRTVRSLGPVPILATLPPVGLLTGGENRRIASANRVIWAVARNLGVPLINVWRAMTQPQMINNGISPDGLHLGVIGGDANPRILTHAANLTPPATRYGANRRNLIWLQALRRLDRAVAAARRGAPGG